MSSSLPPAAANPFRIRTALADAIDHPAWRQAREAALAALAGGRAVAVLGAAGTGRSTLLRHLAADCEARDLTVRRIDGSMPPTGADEGEGGGGDIVVVDEADRVPSEALAELLGGSRTYLLAARPDFAARLAFLPQPTEAVPLAPLSPQEVAHVLAARLAQASLPRFVFEADAVRAVARQSRGVIRQVLVLAGAAWFLAEEEGAARVAARHVDEAAAMHGNGAGEAAADDAADDAAGAEEATGAEEASAAEEAGGGERASGAEEASGGPRLPPPAAVARTAGAAPWPALGRRAALGVGAALGAAGVGLAMLGIWAGAMQRRPMPVPMAAQAPAPPAAVPLAPPPAAPGREVTTGPSEPVAPPTAAPPAAAPPAAAPPAAAAPAAAPPAAAPPAAAPSAAAPAVPAPPAAAPPPPEPRPVPVLEPVTFRGPVFNVTLKRRGMLSLALQRQPGSDAVTAQFHAWAGLIGTGELAGTLSPSGAIVASGRLRMGRNLFDCTLEGRIVGRSITGEATFVSVNGRSRTTRSTFTLNQD